MFVSEYMTRRVQSVRPDWPTGRALEMMRDKGFEALPVVSEGGRLEGIVTEHDILFRLSEDPSPDFLKTVTVRDVMADTLQTIEEGEIIESAAYLMRTHDYSALPVVDDEGRLTGIVTQADIFNVLVKMMGLTEKGTRITLVVPDKRGVLADIAAIIKRNGISIASVATVLSPEHKMGHVIFRLRTIDADDVVSDLVEAGMRVVHVSQVWE